MAASEGTLYRRRKGFSDYWGQPGAGGRAQLLNRPSLGTRQLLRKLMAELLRRMSAAPPPQHTHTDRGEESALSSTSFPGTRAKTLIKERFLRGLVPLALYFLQ